MGIQAQDTIAEKTFAGSLEVFEIMTAELSSATTLGMTHSDVEGLVEERGRMLLRQLYQDHLDLRAAREREERLAVVVGEDGVGRKHRRPTHCPLTTLFGEVEVSRTGYSARASDSRFPLDAELNLPADQYSLPLRRRVAETAAQVSFESVVETIHRTTGAALAKRQAEELAKRAAQDFESFYASRVPKEGPSGDILVLSTDGKGIVMRPEDLREPTRKKAMTQHPKLRHRLTAGEKSHRKRMATVAAVWTVARLVRTPEDIVEDLRGGEDRPKPKRPRPEAKRVWASVERQADEVIEQAYQEALLRDPERTKEWVAVVDGNEPQLAAIQEAARRHGVKVRIVLDVIHVLEYLWDAAWAFFPKASPQAEQWVTDHLVMLLRGKAIDVAAGIRRSATRRNLSAKERAPVDDCADYLHKYSSYLYYDLYLARGYPIASGVIEGACRHLIKDRMDLTGARWRLGGAEAVLRLRALRSSGDFDEYWTFHERNELARNHATRYAAAEIPQRPSLRRAALRLVRHGPPSASS